MISKPEICYKLARRFIGTAAVYGLGLPPAGAYCRKSGSDAVAVGTHSAQADFEIGMPVFGIIA